MKKEERERVFHTFPPFYEKDSKILLLGSMPSRKSRELSFYYMHPQNRFWRVLAKVLEEDLPESIEEKKAFLRKHHIALWDCIESCEIEGSKDASIQNVIPTDLTLVLSNASIERIYTTGKKAQELYEKYQVPQGNPPAICLPSTSSANIANYTEEELVKIYQRIKSDENK